MKFQTLAPPSWHPLSIARKLRPGSILQRKELFHDQSH
mgnify:CR=1 FL=1